MRVPVAEIEAIVKDAFTTLRAEKAREGVEVDTTRAIFKRIPLHMAFSDACERAFKREGLWPGRKEYRRYQERGEKTALENLEQEVLRGGQKRREKPAPLEKLDWKTKVDQFNTSLTGILKELEVAVAGNDKKKTVTYLNTLRELTAAGAREARSHGDAQVAENVSEMREFVTNTYDEVNLLENGFDDAVKTRILTVAKKLLVPVTPSVSGERASGPVKVETVDDMTKQELAEKDIALRELRATFETQARGGDMEGAFNALAVIVDFCNAQKDSAVLGAHPRSEFYRSRASRAKQINAFIRASMAENRHVSLDATLQTLDQILSDEEPTGDLVLFATIPETGAEMTLRAILKESGRVRIS